MSAVAVTIGANLTTGGAGVLLVCSGWAHQSTPKLVIACVGAVGGVALTASSLLMLDDWSALMQHFDFTYLNDSERGRSTGMIPSIYFLPYNNALAGVLATGAFGRYLYRLVRGLE
ncbi:MAG: hypothetical protein K8S25_13250 [Alphaproteobacteria bacterium]|nr:hypothetical protein [Alphaproteobacteria bacterium]